MKKLLWIVTAALISGTAGAQTKPFEGFSATLNLNLIGTSNKVKFDQDPETGPDSTTMMDGLGKNSVAGTMQAAYGFSVGQNLILSVGGTYALGAPKTWTLIDDVNGPTSGKARNMASLYIEPGYLISDKTMAYGKLSYETAKVDIPSGDADVVSVNSKKVHGTGLGFGIRTMLNKNMFLQTEIRRIDYRTASAGAGITDIKTSATVGGVGLGWKF